MKRIAFILALLLPLSAVQAHGDHEPVSEVEALAIAVNIAGQFAEFDSGLDFGLLDSSWIGLPVEAARIHVRAEAYYIVTVTNPKEGRSLYLLMSDAGDVYDANFSGEFPKLE